MSMSISPAEYHEKAKSLSPDNRLYLTSLLDRLSLVDCVELMYTSGSAHENVTASFVRPDGGRCKIFACYANGDAVLQYYWQTPREASMTQRLAVARAYDDFRTRTGGPPTHKIVRWTLAKLRYKLEVDELVAAVSAMSRDLRIVFL